MHRASLIARESRHLEAMSCLIRNRTEAVGGIAISMSTSKDPAIEKREVEEYLKARHDNVGGEIPNVENLDQKCDRGKAGGERGY
jgi:hypothetical protein